MTIVRSFKVTCDVKFCKKKADDMMGWAVIDVEGSSHLIHMLPNQTYTICPECWKKFRSQIQTGFGGSLRAV